MNFTPACRREAHGSCDGGLRVIGTMTSQCACMCHLAQFPTYRELEFMHAQMATRHITPAQRCAIRSGVRPACIIGEHDHCPHGKFLFPAREMLRCTCICHFRHDSRGHFCSRSRSVIRAYLFHRAFEPRRAVEVEQTVTTYYEPNFGQGWVREYLQDRRDRDKVSW